MDVLERGWPAHGGIYGDGVFEACMKLGISTRTRIFEAVDVGLS